LSKLLDDRKRDHLQARRIFTEWLEYESTQSIGPMVFNYRTGQKWATLYGNSAMEERATEGGGGLINSMVGRGSSKVFFFLSPTTIESIFLINFFFLR
jgi:hypothetical protein